MYNTPTDTKFWRRVALRTEEDMRNLRSLVVMLIAMLALAACQGGGSENIDSLDDLAGKTVCVGASTTYLFWIEGTLNLPEGSGEIAEVPEGMQATELATDTDCAQAWRSGRTGDFQGWLTALPTAQTAIDEGFPIRLVGEPVFYEPLAVAFDKAEEDNDSLVAAVERIIAELHADGTLSELGGEWYPWYEGDITRAEGTEPAEPEGDLVTCDSDGLDGHLAAVCDAGVIVVSTDPAYPPQSFLNPETAEYEGFDIDVAREIGERLGVDVEFTDPTFDAVVAGGWNGRWDMSVGSVTVTAERQEVLDFTQPYYFTPAQMSVFDASAGASPGAS